MCRNVFLTNTPTLLYSNTPWDASEINFKRGIVMKKKKKIIIIVLISVLLILVFIPIIVTRSFFIKAFILPGVSESVGIPIECESISLNPFSSAEIKDLSLGETEDPFLTSKIIKCRFSLFSIIGGNIKVDEISADDVKVRLVQNTEGEWSLPLLNKKKRKSSSKAPPGTKKENKEPFNLELTNISFTNFNAHLIQEGNSPDQRKEIMLHNTSLNIPSLKNDGEKHSASLKGSFSRIYVNNLKVENAAFNIDTKIALNEKLLPKSIELDGVLNELDGEANRISLKGHEVKLFMQTDMDDMEKIRIKSFKLTETHNAKTSASIDIKGDFSLSPLTAKADINIGPVTPNAFNLIGAVIGDFDFGNTNASYKVSLTFDKQQNLNAEGTMAVNDLSVVSEKMKLKKLKPMKLVFNHNVSANLKDRIIHVNALDVNVSDTEKKIMDLSVSEPFYLSMDDKTAGKAKAPKIMLNCYEFPLNMVNAAADTGIESGTLNAKIETVLGNLGKNIDINGTLNINNLKMEKKGLALKNMNLRQTVNANLKEFNRLKISQAETRISAKDKRVMDMQLTGDVDIKKMEGDLVAQIYGLNEDIMELFPTDTVKNSPEKFNIKARIKTILKGKKDIKSSCNFAVTDLIPANCRNRNDTPLNVDCRIIAGIKAETVSMESLFLKLNSPSRQLALIKGNALYQLNPANGASEFVLETQGVDLKAIENLIPEKIQKNDNEPENGEPGNERKKTPGEPGPIDLKGMQLLGKIVMKDISYEKVEISEGLGIIKISDNKVYIKPFEMTVNESKMNVAGFIDLGVKGFKYDLSSDVKELPIDTFISIFQPELQGTVSGGIKTFDFKLKGQGVSRKHLKKNLTAKGALSLNNIQIENLPFQILLTDSFQSGIMKDISSLALQSKEESNKILKFLDFKKMGFQDGIFKFDILNGILKSDTFNLVGKNHYISGDGGMNIFDKSLKDLKFDIGISEKMAEKIGMDKKYLDAFDKKDDYYFLPAELGFSGKYPDFEFEYKDAVKEVLVGIAKNIGISTLKEKVPEVGELLENILSPKKKRDKDNPDKDKKNDPRSILDDLLK
jgi:hypothetical protein